MTYLFYLWFLVAVDGTVFIVDHEKQPIFVPDNGNTWFENFHKRHEDTPPPTIEEDLVPVGKPFVPEKHSLFRFFDKNIGKDFFAPKQLEGQTNYKKSSEGMNKKDSMLDDESLYGVRLTGDLSGLASEDVPPLTMKYRKGSMSVGKDGDTLENIPAPPNVHLIESDPHQQESHQITSEAVGNTVTVNQPSGYPTNINPQVEDPLPTSTVEPIGNSVSISQNIPGNYISPDATRLGLVTTNVNTTPVPVDTSLEQSSPLKNPAQLSINPTNIESGVSSISHSISNPAVIETHDVSIDYKQNDGANSLINNPNNMKPIHIYANSEKSVADAVGSLTQKLPNQLTTAAKPIKSVEGIPINEAIKSEKEINLDNRFGDSYPNNVNRITKQNPNVEVSKAENHVTSSINSLQQKPYHHHQITIDTDTGEIVHEESTDEIKVHSPQNVKIHNQPVPHTDSLHKQSPLLDVKPQPVDTANSDLIKETPIKEDLKTVKEIPTKEVENIKNLVLQDKHDEKVSPVTSKIHHKKLHRTVSELSPTTADADMPGGEHVESQSDDHNANGRLDAMSSHEQEQHSLHHTPHSHSAHALEDLNEILNTNKLHADEEEDNENIDELNLPHNIITGNQPVDLISNHDDLDFQTPNEGAVTEHKANHHKVIDTSGAKIKHRIKQTDAATDDDTHTELTDDESKEKDSPSVHLDEIKTLVAKKLAVRRAAAQLSHKKSKTTKHAHRRHETNFPNEVTSNRHPSDYQPLINQLYDGLASPYQPETFFNTHSKSHHNKLHHNNVHNVTVGDEIDENIESDAGINHFVNKHHKELEDEEIIKPKAKEYHIHNHVHNEQHIHIHKGDTHPGEKGGFRYLRLHKIGTVDHDQHKSPQNVNLVSENAAMRNTSDNDSGEDKYQKSDEDENTDKEAMQLLKDYAKSKRKNHGSDFNSTSDEDEGSRYTEADNPDSNRDSEYTSQRSELNINAIAKHKVTSKISDTLDEDDDDPDNTDNDNSYKKLVDKLRHTKNKQQAFLLPAGEDSDHKHVDETEPEEGETLEKRHHKKRKYSFEPKIRKAKEVVEPTYMLHGDPHGDGFGSAVIDGPSELGGGENVGNTGGASLSLSTSGASSAMYLPKKPLHEEMPQGIDGDKRDLKRTMTNETKLKNYNNEESKESRSKSGNESVKNDDEGNFSSSDISDSNKKYGENKRSGNNWEKKREENNKDFKGKSENDEKQTKIGRKTFESLLNSNEKQSDEENINTTSFLSNNNVKIKNNKSSKLISKNEENQKNEGNSKTSSLANNEENGKENESKISELNTNINKNQKNNVGDNKTPSSVSNSKNGKYESHSKSDKKFENKDNKNFKVDINEEEKNKENTNSESLLDGDERKTKDDTKESLSKPGSDQNKIKIEDSENVNTTKQDSEDHSKIVDSSKESDSAEEKNKHLTKSKLSGDGVNNGAQDDIKKNSKNSAYDDPINSLNKYLENENLYSANKLMKTADSKDSPTNKNDEIEKNDNEIASKAKKYTAKEVDNTDNKSSEEEKNEEIKSDEKLDEMKEKSIEKTASNKKEETLEKASSSEGKQETDNIKQDNEKSKESHEHGKTTKGSDKNVEDKFETSESYKNKNVSTISREENGDNNVSVKYKNMEDKDRNRKIKNKEEAYKNISHNDNSNQSTSQIQKDTNRVDDKEISASKDAKNKGLNVTSPQEDFKRKGQEENKIKSEKEVDTEDKDTQTGLIKDENKRYKERKINDQLDSKTEETKTTDKERSNEKPEEKSKKDSNRISEQISDKSEDNVKNSTNIDQEQEIDNKNQFKNILQSTANASTLYPLNTKEAKIQQKPYALAPLPIKLNVDHENRLISFIQQNLTKNTSVLHSPELKQLAFGIVNKVNMTSSNRTAAATEILNNGPREFLKTKKTDEESYNLLHITRDHSTMFNQPREKPLLLSNIKEHLMNIDLDGMNSLESKIQGMSFQMNKMDEPGLKLDLDTKSTKFPIPDHQLTLPLLNPGHPDDINGVKNNKNKASNRFNVLMNPAPTLPPMMSNAGLIPQAPKTEKASGKSIISKRQTMKLTEQENELELQPFFIASHINDLSLNLKKLAKKRSQYPRDQFGSNYFNEMQAPDTVLPINFGKRTRIYQSENPKHSRNNKWGNIFAPVNKMKSRKQDILSLANYRKLHNAAGHSHFNSYMHQRPGVNIYIKRKSKIQKPANSGNSKHTQNKNDNSKRTFIESPSYNMIQNFIRQLAFDFDKPKHRRRVLSLKRSVDATGR